MICLHRWIVAEKTEQPSKAEIARDTGDPQMAWFAEMPLTRPVIVTYRCAKCGAEKVERV